MLYCIWVLLCRQCRYNVFFHLLLPSLFLFGAFFSSPPHESRLDKTKYDISNGNRIVKANENAKKEEKKLAEMQNEMKIIMNEMA